MKADVLVVPWASSAVKTANCCVGADCTVVLNVQLVSLEVDCMVFCLDQLGQVGSQFQM